MRTSILIYGQQWVPESFYNKYYASRVAEAFADPNTIFLIGAGDGIDTYAQRQLAELATPKKEWSRVTIYNKGSKDGRIQPLFDLKNGFKSYPDRDIWMFMISSVRIATLAQVGGGASGCMLFSLLEALGDPESALESLKAIRAITEPYDPEFFNKMTQLYNEKYS